ncbi:MAG: SAF domain-containing protein, partial [Actinomycetes bacterium]
AFVYSSVAASDPVLRVNRTIHRGEVITEADLAVVSVGAGIDVRTVTDERLREVVGRAAVSDIPGGSLLVEGSWGDPGQPLGTARVGVRIEPGRYPATDLVPGTSLLVVALPDANAVGAQAELPASVETTLVDVPAAQPDGSVTVDLHVPSTQAETVARLASADRVSLVQQGSAR